MHFCSRCGSTVEFRVPEGDSLPRHVCPSCHSIHYQNPRIVMGCVPQWQGKLLLCRRAINPRKGFWTLPAGFLENGETLAAGAARETLEEANAEVALLNLYTVVNVPHIHQVHMFYLGNMLNGQFSPGVESLETALFAEEEIPWDEMAFPTVVKTLRAYYEDLRRGQFNLRVMDITHPIPRPAESVPRAAGA